MLGLQFILSLIVVWNLCYPLYLSQLIVWKLITRTYRGSLEKTLRLSLQFAATWVPIATLPFPIGTNIGKVQQSLCVRSLTRLLTLRLFV